jgi:hypothetical protein
VQPPPGFSPQSGPSPHDPWQAGPGYGQRPADGGYSASPAPNRSPSQPGYGRPPGYGSAFPGQHGYADQPGYGQPSGYSQQPNHNQQAGYGQRPGYGQPDYGQGGYYGRPNSGPSNQQMATWAVLGTIALLGGLATVLTLVLCLDVSSVANRASNVCGQYRGEILEACQQAMKNSGLHVPAAAIGYLILLVFGGVAAVVGAVLLFLRKQAGQYLVLGGGVVLLLFAVIFEAQYGAAGRITYDLIAGLFLAIAGGLLLVSQVRQFLNLPPLSAGTRPGQYGGGQYGGGQAPYGGQGPYGQPQLGQYGQPGPGGYPPRQW